MDLSDVLISWMPGDGNVCSRNSLMPEMSRSREWVWKLSQTGTNGDPYTKVSQFLEIHECVKNYDFVSTGLEG